MIFSLMFTVLGAVLALNGTLGPPVNDTDKVANTTSDIILRPSGLSLRRDLSHGSCNQLRVSYPHESDYKIDPSKCKFPIKMKHDNWDVHRRRNFNTSIDTDWLSLFQDHNLIMQPWCLRFKIDYIIQEDTGLAEIRIAVICGSRRMHALRIGVDSYDNTATKVFEFQEYSQILNGNCSDIVDVMLNLYINGRLQIFRNNSNAYLVLAENTYDYHSNETQCDCSSFERFESRLGWCGGGIFRDEFFGKRFYVVLSMLLGTGLLVTISLTACNLIQNPAK